MILLSFLIFVWDTSDPKIHDWLMILMKLLMSAQLGFGGNTMFVMAIACVNPSMVSLRKAWLVICVLDGAILWLLGQRIATIWIGGFP
jgi:hypothetical protein